MAKKLTPIFQRVIMTPMTWGAGVQAFGAIGRVFLAMVVAPWDMIIDRLMFLSGTTTTGNVRMGIYREGATIDLADGGALVAESGSTAKAANVMQVLTIPNTFLKAGRYYVGVMSDTITDQYRSNTFATNPDRLGESWFANGGGYTNFNNPCPATGGASAPPIVGVRVKQVLAYAK